MVDGFIVKTPGAVRHDTLPEPVQHYSVTQGIVKLQVVGHVMVIDGVLKMCNAKVMKMIYFTFKMATYLITFCNVINAVKAFSKNKSYLRLLPMRFSLMSPCLSLPLSYLALISDDFI